MDDFQQDPRGPVAVLDTKKFTRLLVRVVVDPIPPDQEVSPAPAICAMISSPLRGPLPVSRTVWPRAPISRSLGSLRRVLEGDALLHAPKGFDYGPSLSGFPRECAECWF